MGLNITYCILISCTVYDGMIAINDYVMQGGQSKSTFGEFSAHIWSTGHTFGVKHGREG